VYVLTFVGNIFLATLPALFWLWWYLRQDRRRPEPRRHLVLVFILGMLVTIPVLFLEFTVDLFIPFTGSALTLSSAFGALLVVAPFEELGKFLIVWAGVYRNRAFDEGVDGIVYMVTAAMGFATVENILIVFREGVSILPLRFVTATLLHVLASGIIGYFLGRAKLHPARSGRLMTQGLVIGILLHGFYDFIAIIETDAKFFMLFVLLLLMFLILDGSLRHLKQEDREHIVRQKQRDSMTLG
jgi:RsiW-degrading membrane proteinase PrsW (M82 family)